MNIHAHILTWNEEKILPFTLDYYSNICSQIFIYDNMSTDSSDEIFSKSEFNKVNKFGVHYFNIPFEYMEKTLEEGYNVI